MRISLANSTRTFSVAPDRPLLEAALSAGLDVPQGCRGGNCGVCRARLRSGSIRYPNGRPLGLSETEVEQGYILLCQATAVDDLCIETVGVALPENTLVKRLPGRIERLRRLAHDVLGVYLRLPVVEKFEFAPGHYVDIILSGGRRRSFSIASPPHDSALLELHVRRVPGGELTERLFSDAACGTLLTLEGPLGHFVYRSDRRSPLLLVGGGTGLAPLMSILRHVLDTGIDRDVTLYWGVRSERDLYLDAELNDLVRRSPRFRYTPVLSEAGDGWNGRRGLVHAAVLSDARSLSGADIYASGPPAMIDAVMHDFPAQGADPARLYGDAFAYASDTRECQVSSAATRS